MRKSWSRSLPPVSPDYSGACSCLYELKPLIVIHDAAGCTGNYTGYDEPRWYDRPAPVFCSNLRELDAVLGRDDRLISGIEDCLGTIRPEVILICGSPVPAVIGTDFDGIAAEIEANTGILTIGLPTNGTHLYNWGYARCLEALVRRVLNENEPLPDQPSGAATVTLLGLSAIDGMDREYTDWLRQGLSAAGMTDVCSVTMDCAMSELAQIARSSAVWILSEAAEGAAALVRRRNPALKIVRGLPLTDRQRDGMIRALLEDGEAAPNLNSASAAKKALIVAEAYLAESIAAMLRDHGDWETETLVLQEDLGFSSSGRVLHIDSEDALRERISRSDAALIVADPLLKKFAPAQPRFFDWPQFSLSSHLYGADARSVRLIARQFLESMERTG